MNFNEHDLELKHTDLLQDTYRYKLMIVDDSSIARKLIKKYASEINANVVCEASSAEEAFNKYVEFEPDVVTMDISMPGSSGLQAVSRIRGFDPDAKILMVTSHGEESMVIDALELGAKGFLLKPVTKEKLQEQFSKVKHDPYKMFKSVHYFKDVSEKSLKKLLKLNVRDNFVAFVAEDSKEVIGKLRDMPFDCIGGIFPEIIFDGNVYHEGFVLLELSKEANYKFIKHIDKEIDPSIKTLLKDKKTVLTLADGLSAHLDSFLKDLSTMLHENINLIGCATGSRDMKQNTSLFTPKGNFEDAALVIYSHEPIQTAQGHGWKKLAGAFEITKTRPNTIDEFDDEEKALELYQNILKTECDVTIDHSEFLGTARMYPLGIKKRQQTIIREIIKKNENGLYALGDFDLNTLVYIMQSNPDDLETIVQEVLNEATTNIPFSEVKFSFIIEGIGRRHYNNSDELINHDLGVIKEKLKNTPQCGAVSLMEFSNHNSKEIEIHNYSILMGVIQ